MIDSVKQKEICFHCGDIVIRAVNRGDKTFCCDGCSTVHKILVENGMDDYYRMTQNPGIKVTSSDSEQFAYLDAPEISNLLIDFKNENLVKLSLKIPAIHCSSCIWLLENLHLLHPGILNSRVDFLKKEFTANIDPEKITIRKLAELLRDIGYKPEISLQDEQKSKSNRTDRDLLLKLAVAGFCFGNIMLLSFPEYFGMSLKEDASFYRFFSYINLLLGVPVLLYSASDYFTSAYKALRKKIIHINVPLALGMVALFARSVYEILWEAGPGYMDSFSGLLFFLLAGKWFQNYTYEHLNFERDYKSYFPLAVTIFKDDQWTSTLLSNIHKGDRLKIRNGELIPADAIVFNGDAYIDYSFVTGESVPVHKVLGEIVYGGGRQLGGAIEVEILKEVSQSQLTKIWNSQGDNLNQSRLTSFSELISKYFTIALIAIAFITLIVWSFIDLSIGFFAFTSVLIVACPCALALSSPLALGNTLRLLGSRGFYLKNAQVVEQLARVNHIVFDKTGTLTTPQEFEVQYVGDFANDIFFSAVKSLVDQSQHPYSRAISGKLQNYKLIKVDQFAEISGSGIQGTIESVGFLKLGSASFCGALNTTDYAGVYVSVNGIVMGHFSIKNHYRSFITKLLKRLGVRYKISVLSGDTAREKHGLMQVWNGFQQVFFGQTPEDKKNRISELSQKGDVVMMVGDGLNDAGALMSSDVGVVIAENASQFTPAAKGIIMSEKLPELNRMLRLCVKTLQTIRISFGISLMYNLVGLYFAVQGQLSPVIAAILMPLSSITVVLFNTFYTNYMAHKLKLR